MRRNHDKYTRRDTIVISIGLENAASFHHYWQSNNLPFIGLPDKKHSVLKLYGQQVKLFKFGRQPAQMIIDKQGILRFVHYGHSMSDIPTSEEVLSLLDKLQTEAAADALEG